jgi:hypothetical protein
LCCFSQRVSHPSTQCSLCIKVDYSIDSHNVSDYHLLNKLDDNCLRGAEKKHAFSTTYHNPHESCNHAIPTRSPILCDFAFGPRATTIPTPSCPGHKGSLLLTGQSPSIAWTSVWQHPLAWILTRMSEFNGTGIARVSIENLPLWVFTIAAFILKVVRTIMILNLKIDYWFMILNIKTVKILTMWMKIFQWTFFVNFFHFSVVYQLPVQVVNYPLFDMTSFFSTILIRSGMLMTSLLHWYVRTWLPFCNTNISLPLDLIWIIIYLFNYHWITVNKAILVIINTFASVYNICWMPFSLTFEDSSTKIDQLHYDKLNNSFFNFR